MGSKWQPNGSMLHIQQKLNRLIVNILHSYILPQTSKHCQWIYTYWKLIVLTSEVQNSFHGISFYNTDKRIFLNKLFAFVFCQLWHYSIGSIDKFNETQISAQLKNKNKLLNRQPIFHLRYKIKDERSKFKPSNLSTVERACCATTNGCKRYLHLLSIFR